MSSGETRHPGRGLGGVDGEDGGMGDVGISEGGEEQSQVKLVE